MTVNVVGTLWAGCQASYSYHLPDSAPIPDAAAVKRLAGDFQAIEDFQVVRVTIESLAIPSGTRTKVDRVTVREWETEEAADVFAEADF